MIIDVTIIIIWGKHKERPFKTANLIDKYVCSNYSPVSFLHLSLPYSLRLNNIEIRPITNTVASKCSNIRKSCISLTLNLKLGMIKLDDKYTLKTKIGGKLDFLYQLPKLWMQ